MNLNIMFKLAVLVLVAEPEVLLESLVVDQLNQVAMLVACLELVVPHQSMVQDLAQLVMLE